MAETSPVEQQTCGVLIMQSDARYTAQNKGMVARRMHRMRIAVEFRQTSPQDRCAVCPRRPV